MSVFELLLSAPCFHTGSFKGGILLLTLTLYAHFRNLLISFVFQIYCKTVMFESKLSGLNAPNFFLNFRWKMESVPF